MKLIQYMGPFRRGQVITVPAQIDITYTQIGFYTPYVEKIININSFVSEDISINGNSFHINEKGFLEFENLEEISLRIQFLKDFPEESSIEIGYNISDI